MNNPSKPLLLLDTHIWIWLINGSDKLKSTKVLRKIEESSKKGLIRVSAISLWEVAMLESKERIRFPLNCLDWIRQALSAPGTSVVPLDPEIAVESTRLPGQFSGLDPADQILIATARKIGATLVTQDKVILKYSKQNHVHVLT